MGRAAPRGAAPCASYRMGRPEARTSRWQAGGWQRDAVSRALLALGFAFTPRRRAPALPLPAHPGLALRLHRRRQPRLPDRAAVVEGAPRAHRPPGREELPAPGAFPTLPARLLGGPDGVAPGGRVPLAAVPA